MSADWEQIQQENAIWPWLDDGSMECEDVCESFEPLEPEEEDDDEPDNECP